MREREGREGDSQPMPLINDEPFIHDLVKDDLEARKQLGARRYGTPLQAHNGRDAVRDAYEESLDLSVYLKQALMEMTFQGWLEMGMRLGYCSEPVCNTHDGLPSSPEEDAQWDDGQDPCVPAVRLYVE